MRMFARHYWWIGMVAGLLSACAAPIAHVSTTPPVVPTMVLPPVVVSLAPAERLQALDLQQLVTQPGTMPQDFRVWQTLQRLPDTFRDIPQAINKVNLTLKRGDTQAGSVTLLVYPSLAERNQAFTTIRRNVLRIQLADYVVVSCQPLPSCKEDIPPAPTLEQLEAAADRQRASVGERSHTAYSRGVGIASHGQVVWARCGAVAQIRLAYEEPKPGELNQVLREYATALDEQLAAQVCSNK